VILWLATGLPEGRRFVCFVYWRSREWNGCWAGVVCSTGRQESEQCFQCCNVRPVQRFRGGWMKRKVGKSNSQLCVQGHAVVDALSSFVVVVVVVVVVLLTPGLVGRRSWRVGKVGILDLAICKRAVSSSHGPCRFVMYPVRYGVRIYILLGCLKARRHC
jgi:hypothetical protein